MTMLRTSIILSALKLCVSIYCSEPIEGDDMEPAESPNYPQCAVCKDMTPWELTCVLFSYVCVHSCSY